MEEQIFYLTNQSACLHDIQIFTILFVFWASLFISFSSAVDIGNSKKLIPGAYAHGMYKTYFKNIKKLGIFLTCSWTCSMCACKDHIKPTLFVPCVKRTKKCLEK